ncbi:unnamed protein product [marine sediment metagenome]|uniref:Uncharacterized protein n=1 Tax=marine sediment metagenome TaxID=412755 RepID=X1P5L3_9ZZZZ
MANFKLRTWRISIVSSKSIPPELKATCMFCSNIAFSSSSGSRSKNIPKSCKFICSNPFKVSVLNVEILFFNTLAVKG